MMDAEQAIATLDNLLADLKPFYEDAFKGTERRFASQAMLVTLEACLMEGVRERYHSALGKVVIDKPTLIALHTKYIDFLTGFTADALMVGYACALADLARAEDR